MSKLIQGARFGRVSEMNPTAHKEAMDVLEKLAAAYYAGRDSAQYATNIREEARDQLIEALAAMRTRRVEVGPFRIIRNRDTSRSLNIQKLNRLLGDKADRLELCYDLTPRQSIQVYHHRAEELATAARNVGRKPQGVALAR